MKEKRERRQTSKIGKSASRAEQNRTSSSHSGLSFLLFLFPTLSLTHFFSSLHLFLSPSYHPISSSIFLFSLSSFSLPLLSFSPPSYVSFLILPPHNPSASVSHLSIPSPSPSSLSCPVHFCLNLPSVCLSFQLDNCLLLHFPRAPANSQPCSPASQSHLQEK